MFETRALYFAPPTSWEDPYEKVLVHRRSHAFFAQCWGKRAVSDAMWRIYSPDRTAVRIRTTRTNLANALKSAKKKANFGYLVHDVDYVPSKKIDARISKIAKDLEIKYDSRRAADALLVKRDAFDHEAEVRVIVHDTEATVDSKPKSSFRVTINPHALIESVFFDPRADDTFVQVCSYYLKEALKLKRSIGKSALYRTREQVVIE